MFCQSLETEVFCVFSLKEVGETGIPHNYLYLSRFRMIGESEIPYLSGFMVIGETGYLITVSFSFRGDRGNGATLSFSFDGDRGDWVSNDLVFLLSGR